MAMGKNKTGIMAAITAAADASNSDRAHRALPKGTIGSVRAGLGGIQEIETELILPWGPKDRLGTELTAVNSEAAEAIEELANSIGETGQQVPALLRPSKTRDGFFEVIYGRRRILACRSLGIPVKALIRTLDDSEALMAKGLENASRADLSFYERARFAQAILDQGYERSEVCQALAISKNTLSQLERVTRHVPEQVGDAIGAAPKAGRPKWMGLARAFETGALSLSDALATLSSAPDPNTSDNRLERLVQSIGQAARGAEPEQSPMPGVRVKRSERAISVQFERAGEASEFAAWLDTHLDEVLRETFERFQSATRDEDGG